MTPEQLAERGVSVRDLEWTNDKDSHVMARADAIGGTYFIIDDYDDFTGVYLDFVSHDDARWWQHVRATTDHIMDGFRDDDIAPVKAAANAHNKSRILAALEAST